MLTTFSLGGGEVVFDEASGRGRLSLPAKPSGYADAQLDDYHRPKQGWQALHRPFTARPPLDLTVRARASSAAPPGTLGFGFWNEPFSVTGGVLGSPSVAWFFYASEPSDMALAEGVPGWGWKAATLHMHRVPGLILAPAALAAAALTQIPGLGAPILRLARRFAVAHEALLDDVALNEWHEYRLAWTHAEARFYVDGAVRLASPSPPAGPLGLVIWIDNQYAVASLSGHFGFGTCPVPEPQWLELDGLRLVSEA